MLELGPVGREVCERVWAARHKVRKSGADPSAYTVHVALNLWHALLFEMNEVRFEGTIFGLKITHDRTLDDDQIRLRHEVIA